MLLLITLFVINIYEFCKNSWYVLGFHSNNAKFTFLTSLNFDFLLIPNHSYPRIRKDKYTTT